MLDRVTVTHQRWAALCLACAGAAWVLFFAPRGVFHGDAGVRFAQIHSLASSNFSTRALLYNYEVDPQSKHYPYYPPAFLRDVDGKKQGNYSIVSTAINAVILKAFGADAVMFLLSLLSYLLIIVGMERIMRLRGIPPPVAIAALAIASLATPLLFYASQLTDHINVAAAAVWSVYFLHACERTPKRTLIAGMIMALGAMTRPDGYCLIAALGIAVLVDDLSRRQWRWRTWIGYGAGALSLLLVFWFVNYGLSGTWDTSAAGRQNHLGQGSFSMKVSMILLWGEVKMSYALGVFGAGALIAVAFITGVFRHSTARMVVAIVLSSVAVVFAFLVFSKQHARIPAGLFSVSPIVLIPLCMPPSKRRDWFLPISIVAFVVQIVALERTGTGGGLQLSARFLLAAVPLGMLALAEQATTYMALPVSRALRGGLLLVLVSAVVMSARANSIGTTKAIRIARFTEELESFVSKAEPEAIIGIRVWESQLVARALPEGREIYYGGGNWRQLLDRLARNGKRRVAILLNRPVKGRLSSGARFRTIESYKGFVPLQTIVIDVPNSYAPK